VTPVEAMVKQEEGQKFFPGDPAGEGLASYDEAEVGSEVHPSGGEGLGPLVRPAGCSEVPSW
jgi:hypothetical protein